MALKKHSQSLDLLIMAGLKAREGKTVAAASFFAKAAEAEDFDETLEALSEENEDALNQGMDELSEDGDDDLEEEVSAALKKVKSRKQAKASDESQEDEDDMVDTINSNDNSEDVGQKDEASLKRKSRAEANAKLLQAAQRRIASKK